MNASAAVLQQEALFHGRYRVLRCLKAGGMGAVYEVMDEATSSRRALKVMLPGLLSSDELRARFAVEAKITGSVESDHIVRTSDAGVDEETGTPFLVMELLRGEELGSLVRRRKGLPPEEVAFYLYQAGLALDRTHAAGIIHRDLKPDNLFVTVRDDGSPCVKILDFGIAKVLEQQSGGVTTRHMLGTPVYMAPEQIRAEPRIGPRADVHALGHVAYTCLVGETYWSEEADALISPYMLAAEIMRGPSEPPSARAQRRLSRVIPRAFDSWFLCATALRTEDRFESASTAVAELAYALGVPLPRMSRAPFVPEPYAPAEPPPHGGSPGESTVPTGPRRSPADRGATTPAATTPVLPDTGAAPRAVRSSDAPADSVRRPAARSSDAPADSVRRGAASPQPSRSSAPSSESRRGEISAFGRRERATQRRFQVAVDPGSSIVRLKVWGFWDAAEGKAYVDEFRRKIAALVGKRWCVLADISEFPAQKPEVNEFIGQTMAHANASGMRKAANLVSSALTRMQIGRLSADMGVPEYSFFTSESEAVAWLLRDE